MTSLDHWSYAADGTVATVRTAISITPTRKYIERRFPSLGFTVDVGGHPFFEVLLATDRSLFDPANASRRTPANFYASREHSGLMRAGDEPSIYLVPTAVVQRLAGARDIFYTAAGYASAQGKDPVYAIPPAQLAHEAPSVGVASDFQGRALAASLALSDDVLQRVRDDGTSSAAAYDDSELPVESYGDPDRDTEADRAGGEDGYGMTAALDYDEDDGALGSSAQADDEGTYVPSSEPAAAAAALDYYDGYDDPIPAARAHSRAYGDEGADEGDYAAAAAQQSAYGAGVAEPAMLEDEDETRREQDGTYAAAAYSDESDQDTALQAPPYTALGGVPLTAQEQRRIVDAMLAATWPAHSYTAVYPDTEPPSAPASGVSVGIVPFTQWSSTLGDLVKAMEARDAAAMPRFFGAKWKDMRDTVTAAKEAERMKAVEGKELWREPWLTRFKKAGEHKPFQAAQNEAAAAVFLQPIVPYAHGLGLNTDRGMAMLAAIERRMFFNTPWPLGVMLAWVVNVVSPIKTDAQRQQVVGVLGTQFQKAQKLDPQGKAWDNLQHYAVLAELRKRGKSPVPLPTAREMLDAIVKVAFDERDQGASELLTLRKDISLKDTEYTP